MRMSCVPTLTTPVLLRRWAEERASGYAGCLPSRGGSTRDSSGGGGGGQHGERASFLRAIETLEGLASMVQHLSIPAFRTLSRA